MTSPLPAPPSTPCRAPEPAPRVRWRRSGRGVSTIIATILVLAITVTLFGVIFIAIQYFPHPAAANVSQYSVTLAYRPGGSAVTGVSITHLSGPALNAPSTQQGAIYIQSQNRSTLYGPFQISQGLPGGATTWVFGQTWTCTSACAGFPSLFAPDNITVTLTTGGSLVFQQKLQALFPGYAPYFAKAQVVPTSGTSFRAASPSTFTVTATVQCSASCRAANPVSLNYSQFVGKATPAVSMTCSPSGAAVENCTYTSTGSVTSPSASGTYFLFLVAVDSLGRSDTFTLTVSVN